MTALNVGDHVKPKPGWLRGPDSIAIPPFGQVRSVVPLGVGQIVFVGDDKRRWFSGQFDRAEGAA